MTEEKILEELQPIFHDVFDDDEIVLKDDTTAKDIEDWDSLMQITLISEIEDEFNIYFSMKDVDELSNVGQMVDMIMNKVERN